MLNGFGHIERLGAFILWFLKGFNGTFEESRNNKYAFLIGIFIIMFFILIIATI